MGPIAPERDARLRRRPREGRLSACGRAPRPRRCSPPPRSASAPAATTTAPAVDNSVDAEPATAPPRRRRPPPRRPPTSRRHDDPEARDLEGPQEEARDRQARPATRRPKLYSRDIVKGKGKAAKAGDSVTVQYVGVSFSDGEQFDASWDSRRAVSVPARRADGHRRLGSGRRRHAARAAGGCSSSRPTSPTAPQGQGAIAPERDADLRHRPREDRLTRLAGAAAAALAGAQAGPQIAAGAPERDRCCSPSAVSTRKTAWSASVPGLVDDLHELQRPRRRGAEALGGGGARGGLERRAVPALVGARAPGRARARRARAARAAACSRGSVRRVIAT